MFPGQNTILFLIASMTTTVIILGDPFKSQSSNYFILRGYKHLRVVSGCTSKRLYVDMRK